MCFQCTKEGHFEKDCPKRKLKKYNDSEYEKMRLEMHQLPHKDT